MCCDFVVKVLVENDMAASVAPAAYIDGNADRGRMTGCILNVDAHDGVLSAYALRAEADGIDTVLQSFSILAALSFSLLRADRTHKSFLGEERCCLYRSCHTDTYQKRRTRVETIGCHAVHDELSNALISFTGHKDCRTAGKCAAAACHVGVDLTFVRVRNDVPPDCRCTLAYIFACVVLVECLN